MLEFERLIMENLGMRNGLLHPDTVEQSQRLDVLIVNIQKVDFKKLFIGGK